MTIPECSIQAEKRDMAGPRSKISKQKSVVEPDRGDYAHCWVPAQYFLEKQSNWNRRALQDSICEHRAGLLKGGFHSWALSGNYKSGAKAATDRNHIGIVDHRNHTSQPYTPRNPFDEHLQVRCLILSSTTRQMPSLGRRTLNRTC